MRRTKTKPRGRGTPPRTKERSRAGFEMGDRKGRPYEGLVAELVRVGATLAVAHAGVPDGLVWVVTGRHLVRRKRSRAGFGMGDRKGRPYEGLVAGLFA